MAAALCVAVREARTGAGLADYGLLVDGQAMEVIKAKKSGAPLTGVSLRPASSGPRIQTRRPASLVDGALPFGYESREGDRKT